MFKKWQTEHGNEDGYEVLYLKNYNRKVNKSLNKKKNIINTIKTYMHAKLDIISQVIKKIVEQSLIEFSINQLSVFF